MKKLILWLCIAIFLCINPVTAAAAPDSRFSMSYIYFGKSSAYTSLVDSARNSLDEVAPNYFSLDGDGNLVITNAASKDFVTDMHARGIRVVPYLTNDWVKSVGRNALTNEKLIEELTYAVKSTDTVTDDGIRYTGYDLDGINIDIEGLGPDQRNDYVNFVRQLADALHPLGKTVTVAVAANPKGITWDWQGSFDYAALAQYCDYLMIMAYDEHWNGSGPGPVGSMSFTEKSIQYALKCQVPKEKIVLGLPFYGRIWSDSGSYPNGYGVSNTRITQLIADYRGAVTFDSVSRSARAVITIKSDDIKPVIGGKALDPGTYTIWFDNEQTLKEKLDLVRKYGLKGAGSWSLGQEDDSTWNYYKLWLNGCTFQDIQNTWARDYIYNAYMAGWVNGRSPDTFDPDHSLTRAEAAAMLVRRMGYSSEPDPASAFDDTTGSWAEDYIAAARRNKIINGVGGNLFAPDRIVTRQEIAVMLRNILGVSAASGTPVFGDISPLHNPWSYEAIAALSANGVFTGYPDGTFRPEAPVSRAEMAALLTRIP